MQETLVELRRLALGHAAGLRTETAVPRLTINLAHETTEPLAGVCQPMVCVVLQGAKEVMIGQRMLRYDPACYFIAGLELPASWRIAEASRERPYVSLSLRLDAEVLAAVMTDAADAAAGAPDTAAFAVSPMEPSLFDSWLRLLGLLDAPDDIPVMAPLIEREVLYRLLRGRQGGVLRQIARGDSRLGQIRRAIGWIQANYDRPLRIRELAQLAGMSAASFHRHFKTATAMSPLQYQKRLRLHEARRLLIASQDAAHAGYAVGYESASQFSREYARLFGAPPVRDASRLRGDQTALAQIASAA